MKNLIIISISLIVGLSGCTGLKYPTVYHDFNKKPVYKDFHNPKLNTINTIEIGENIYSKSYLYYDNTYMVELLEPAIGSSIIGKVDTSISKEPIRGILQKWSKIGHDNINTMCIDSSRFCLTDLNNDGTFTHFGYGAQLGYELEKHAKYKRYPIEPVLKQDSFKYVALYQGKIDGKIKVSFMEFKNNMARPAFTQDIEYELEKKGKTTIGFKGLRIEVLRATNMDLKYKVIKDYK